MKQLDKQELDERFDCMKKKQIIPLIVLILIVVGVCVWMNRVNYDVCEDTSNVEINPLEGIDVKIDAKRKQLKYKKKMDGINLQPIILYRRSLVPFQRGQLTRWILNGEILSMGH